MTTAKPPGPEYPILPFATQQEFESWLDKNHASIAGVWIKIYKKATGIPSVTHPEALDVALCYGWIDGQSRSFDDQSFLQKFTPRRAKSMWSKRNIEHVARLIKNGKMTPAGQAEIDRAKADGRWAQAYDSPVNMKVPDDFVAEVNKDPIAKATFEKLNKTNLYAIGFRLQTAKKPETRNNRIKVLLEKLKKGETIL